QYLHSVPGRKTAPAAGKHQVRPLRIRRGMPHEQGGGFAGDTGESAGDSLIQQEACFIQEYERRVCMPHGEGSGEGLLPDTQETRFHAVGEYHACPENTWEPGRRPEENEQDIGGMTACLLSGHITSCFSTNRTLPEKPAGISTLS